MAKKSRRARYRSTAKKVAGAGASALPKEAIDNKADKPGASSAAQFGSQYAYVYGDLKRIAIIAGALFAVLVVLSFVIH
ncbi:MAG TPA: hypothetical protein VMW58_12800 [Anaerolineae bacterium]|nr:hypothetical protein [Anaerolineae bacterium]